MSSLELEVKPDLDLDLELKLDLVRRVVRAFDVSIRRLPRDRGAFECEERMCSIRIG